MRPDNLRDHLCGTRVTLPRAAILRPAPSLGRVTSPFVQYVLPSVHAYLSITKKAGNYSTDRTEENQPLVLVATPPSECVISLPPSSLRRAALARSRFSPGRHCKTRRHVLPWSAGKVTSSGVAAVAKRIEAAAKAGLIPTALMIHDHARVAIREPTVCDELAMPAR